MRGGGRRAALRTHSLPAPAGGSATTRCGASPPHHTTHWAANQDSRPRAAAAPPPPVSQGTRPDGSTYSFPLKHTISEGQWTWFKEGSALNAMAKEFAKAKAS